MPPIAVAAADARRDWPPGGPRAVWRCDAPAVAVRGRKEREALLREIRGRRGDPAEGFVRAMRLPEETSAEELGHAAGVPAVAALRGEGLALDPRVTFLVGENGSGKSTLVEALAVASGLNPEGGGRHLRHATRESHSSLGDHLRLVRGSRTPASDFFLRAESLFTLATYLEELPRGLEPYGGTSLHELSHGEALLAIVLNRFAPEGFYVLDEPEAALSAQNVLALMRRIHQLAEERSQFVIATHSPLLLALPGARIVLCDAQGLSEVPYAQVPAVALTRRILADPDAVLEGLLAPD